jgi:hypothetical protein
MGLGGAERSEAETKPLIFQVRGELRCLDLFPLTSKI